MCGMPKSVGGMEEKKDSVESESDLKRDREMDNQREELAWERPAKESWEIEREKKV